MNETASEVKALKEKIYNLQMQLEIQNERFSHQNEGNLLKVSSIDLYEGEQKDFILTILEQVRRNQDDDSRCAEILDSILSQNQKTGKGEAIAKELVRIVKHGDLSKESDKAALNKIGFRYVTSKKHPKLEFMSKYKFPVAGTISDHWRGSLNCYSNVSKALAVCIRI